MKVALVHDYIKEYGGAERVLETLHEMYPDAPVFTLVYCPEFLGPHKERFASWNITTSFLQYLPFKEKFISMYRLFSPFIFQLFDFSGYDVVIVSATGAYSPNMIRTKDKRPYHICYMHTPPRYLYGYATAREWKKNPFFYVCAMIANHFLRMVDFASSKHVDQFIANSQTVADRIKKFYRKDSVVVYPPVLSEVASSKYQVVREKKKNTKYKIRDTQYFLAGGRLARPKHYDIIIKACMQLGVPLKVFGKGFAGYESELHSLAKDLQLSSPTRSGIHKNKNLDSRLRGNDNESLIEFVGEVSDEEKLELMRHAKAFIMASEDEDFGITPVEAMGVGTPVIAYRSGGLRETVVEGKTGVFFDKLTVESLESAIKKFQELTIRPEACIQQAQKFSKENFKKGIQRVIFNS